MFRKKLETILELTPKAIMDFIGIVDTKNILYQNTLQVLTSIIRAAIQGEYVVDINGIPVIVSDEVHQIYTGVKFPKITNNVPMSVVIGPGMPIPIEDHVIVVNRKFLEQDEKFQTFVFIHEIGHILCGDAMNEIAADRYALDFMKEEGEIQLRRIVKMVEDICGDDPAYADYVRAVKIRLDFI